MKITIVSQKFRNMCHFSILQPECKQRCQPFFVYEEMGNDI